MTPESGNLKNALTVLDKACGEYVGTRADHKAIEAAFATVLGTIQSLQEEVQDLRATKGKVAPPPAPARPAPPPKAMRGGRG